MNFIALGIICEIDNLYASSLKSLRIKDAVTEENLPVWTKGGLPVPSEY